MQLAKWLKYINLDLIKKSLKMALHSLTQTYTKLSFTQILEGKFVSTKFNSFSIKEEAFSQIYVCHCSYKKSNCCSNLPSLNLIKHGVKGVYKASKQSLHEFN